MNQEELSERQGAIERPPRAGREARTYRRQRIHSLIRTVVGNTGWRKAFLQAYPDFDTAQGAYLLSRATNGSTDDPDLLAALEEWIPRIQDEKPEWFVKQVSVEMP
ncbi:hypothetical protein [Runella zeae]|uniref:hypothetical protein n=1 Tax=Runella zeae TaxID=94255 RepID=UPI000427023D|nr:hypothetical protein [Runella zeae]